VKTLEIQATTTVGIENKQQKQELLDEIQQELNKTVWDFDLQEVEDQ